MTTRCIERRPRGGASTTRSALPRARRRAGVASLALAAGLALAPIDAHAVPQAKGAGELMLDAPAISAIIEAGIPEPFVFAVPPIGRVTVRLEAPKRVVFKTGGLEAVVGIVVPELGLRGNVDLRYEPEIDAENGLVMLRPVRGKPGGMLAMIPDIAPMLPPVSVPRGFDRVLHPKGGSRVMISVNVHEVVVTDSHLVVRLGLESRPNDAMAAPAPPVRGRDG